MQGLQHASSRSISKPQALHLESCHGRKPSLAKTEIVTDHWIVWCSRIFSKNSGSVLQFAKISCDVYCLVYLLHSHVLVCIKNKNCVWMVFYMIINDHIFWGSKHHAVLPGVSALVGTRSFSNIMASSWVPVVSQPHLATLQAKELRSGCSTAASSTISSWVFSCFSNLCGLQSCDGLLRIYLFYIWLILREVQTATPCNGLYTYPRIIFKWSWSPATKDWKHQMLLSSSGSSFLGHQLKARHFVSRFLCP